MAAEAYPGTPLQLARCCCCCCCHAERVSRHCLNHGGTPGAHPAMQMTDVLRRYPDAAEACVETVAAIPEEVRPAGPASAQTPVARLLRPAELHCTAYRHVHRILPPSAVSACNFPAQSITEPAARAAYLWVLGEFGARIQVRFVGWPAG